MSKVSKDKAKSLEQHQDSSISLPSCNQVSGLHGSPGYTGKGE